MIGGIMNRFSTLGIFNFGRNLHKFRVNSSATTFKRLSQSYNPNYNATWKPQTIFVKVNEDKWNERLDGVMFSTEYVDTASGLFPEQAAQMPLILCVHDSPGWHGDFIPLLKPFVKEGIRVVLVNMPDSLLTNAGVERGGSFVKYPPEMLFFTNTIVERAEFLGEVLQSLSIDRIDLAIGHGFGTLPLLLHQATRSFYKAALFINPIPIHATPKIARPLYISKTLVKGCDFMDDGEIGVRIFKFLTKNFFRAKKIDVKHSHFMQLLQIALHADQKIAKEMSDLVREKDAPVTQVYSTRNTFFSMDQAENHAMKLGIKHEDIHRMPFQNNFSQFDLKTRKRAIGIDSKLHHLQMNSLWAQLLRHECVRLLQLSGAHQEVGFDEAATA